MDSKFRLVSSDEKCARCGSEIDKLEHLEGSHGGPTFKICFKCHWMSHEGVDVIDSSGRVIEDKIEIKGKAEAK